MANLLEILAWLVAAGVAIVSGVIMHRLFGLVGVGLLVAFTVPVAALVVYLGRRGGGQASTSANRGRTRDSKGAHSSRDR